MTMLSIWPTLIILGVTFLALAPGRIFRFLDSSPVAHPHRLDAIDGLRGILASAVFFHHFVMTAYNLKHGTGGLPPSRFYSFIGPGAVSVFFMITGYLFWGRLLDKQGKVEWVELYLNRVFRIYPLYLALVIAYFAFVLWHIGTSNPLSPPDVLVQILQWLALGAVNQPPPFLNHPEFLGVIGQTWSLHYEWLFYLALPLLAVLAREKSAIAIVGSALVFLALRSDVVNQPYNFFIAHFLIGMLSASALRAFPQLKGDGAIRSLAAIVAAAAAIRLSDLPYSNLTTALLGVAFFFVASGTSIFGLLTTDGAKRLGNMSYSVYLLHGLIINVLMQFPRYNANLVFTTQRFWLVTLATYGVVVVVSLVTYYAIERTGINLGRRVTQARQSEPQAQRGSLAK
ncbi:acyltransferase family protein [Burkholderia multivorans]|uniref:acyltransferase family protein n=1 Tax=Burkholderia multivorans TaxID=87883 RepID=UPI001C230330|nr:acyltransferase [Burkholderia multivorans]MBU9608630.1 acyltransferase [Burkholderia multivorans]